MYFICFIFYAIKFSIVNIISRPSSTCLIIYFSSLTIFIMTTLKSLSNKDYIWPPSKKKKNSSMSVHGLIAHFFSFWRIFHCSGIPQFIYRPRPFTIRIISQWWDIVEVGMSESCRKGGNWNRFGFLFAVLKNLLWSLRRERGGLGASSGWKSCRNISISTDKGESSFLTFPHLHPTRSLEST